MQEQEKYFKGASIYDVRKIFGILDPLPRRPCLHLGLNSRNLPYYIFFWANPPLMALMDAP